MKSFAPLLSVVVLALAAAKVEASPLEARAKSDTYCNAQVAKYQSQKWCNAYIRDNGGPEYQAQVETDVPAADPTITETVETTIVDTATVNESSKTTVTVETTKSKTISGVVTITKTVPAYTVTEAATTEPVYYFKNDPSKYRRLAARVNTPANLQGCTSDQIVAACQAKYYSPDAPYIYTSTVTNTVDPTGEVDVTVTSATQTTATTTNSIIKTKTIKDIKETATITNLKTVTEVTKTNAISTETVVPSPVNFSKGALISYSQISDDDYAAPGVWTGPGPYANVAEGNNYKTMYTVNAAKHLVYRGTQIAYLVPKKSAYYNYGEIKFTSDKTTIKDGRTLTCTVKSSTVDGPTDDPAAILGCSAKGANGERYSKLTYIQSDSTSRFGLVADSSSNGAVVPAPSGDAPSDVNFYPVKTFIIAADHIDEALSHQEVDDDESGSATSQSHFNPMAIDA